MIKLGSLLLIAISLMMLMTKCTMKGFTKQEKEIILNVENDSLMRLYVVQNPQDSIVLRKKARLINQTDFSIELLSKLKAGLLCTVQDPAASGVGIAAPQVGVSVQLICVQRFDIANEPFRFYINPIILKCSDEKKIGNEGCLSVPGFYSEVERSEMITVSYLDENFNPIVEEIEGFSAIIFQHEIDHLNGILYFDHLKNGYSSLLREEDRPKSSENE